ncbi:hypothetical protein [Desulfosporosinus sp. FKB]|uniref:hypothetical protein n=1 Tax=Desulfosporosinus sp. FKB TaxID=1969835 RepID=UPI000B49896C|nr:hypothetical protein [Desulfosporosinus sp. FKB]
MTVVSNESFLEAIYMIAEKLKGYALTPDEKKAIIQSFNNSQKPTSAERASEAIEKSIHRPILEKKSFSLDNIDNLLLQMKIEAAKWDKEKQK